MMPARADRARRAGGRRAGGGRFGANVQLSDNVRYSVKAEREPGVAARSGQRARI